MAGKQSPSQSARVPDFRQRHIAPRSEAQTIDPHRSNRRANQAQCGVAHGSGHAPNLTVFSFAYRDFQPRRGDRRAEADRRITRPQAGRLGNAPRCARCGHEVAQIERGAQARDGSIIWFAFHLRPVSLEQSLILRAAGPIRRLAVRLTSRAADPVLERAMIG